MNNFISFNILAENLSIAESLLKSKNIKYFIKGASAVGYVGLGGYSAAFPIEICVIAEDEKIVKKLLAGL